MGVLESLGIRGVWGGVWYKRVKREGTPTWDYTYQYLP